MNIVYFGNGQRAYICLNYLIKNNIQIDCVVSSKLEEKKKTSSLISLAKDYKIKYFLTDDPNEEKSKNFFLGLNADIFILGGYDKILKKHIIEIPKKLCINLHGGKLPEYRGSSPLNWVLINEETEFTISIIKVDTGVDTGEIIKDYTQKIEHNDTIVDLHRKANKYFPKLLLDVINDIRNDRLNYRKQSPKKVSYYPLRNKKDGFILFDQLNASEVHGRIRALSLPYPCAFSFWKSKKVYFITSELNDFKFYGEAGKVYKKTKKGFLICCKDVSIWITKAKFDDGSDAIKLIKKYDSFTTIRGQILSSFENKN